MNSERPYHFEAPAIYQAKKSFAGFTLYLNIDSHNMVEGLFFTGPQDSPWIDGFSELCRLCEGQRLSDEFLARLRLSPAPTPYQKWNLPLWLLRATGREFFQNHHPRHLLVGQKAQDLICRCFGVYLPQIRPFGSLKEVTDETRAGGGCARCRPQIEEIIGHPQKNTCGPPSLSQEEFDKIRQLTAVFVKQQFPKVTVRLTNIEKNCIRIAFSGDEHEKDKVFRGIEKLIEYNFHLKVSLALSP